MLSGRIEGSVAGEGLLASLLDLGLGTFCSPVRNVQSHSQRSHTKKIKCQLLSCVTVDRDREGRERETERGSWEVC